MKQTLILSLILVLFSFNAKAQSDNCITATVVTLDAAGAACVSGTTVNATSANVGYGTCNPLPNTNNEVWYTFVTNGSVNIFDVTPQGMTNPEIVIYTVGCSGTLETCNNIVGTGNLNTSWGLPAGTQIWVGIMSNQGTEGGFDFCINSTAPNPGNGNTCAGAIPLCDKTPFSVPDMSTYTSSGELASCFGSLNQDIWFTFTITQSGTLEWEATPIGGSGTEMDFAVWDVTGGQACPGTETVCNWNYDNQSGNPNGMGMGTPTAEYSPALNVTAGQTFMIQIDNWSNTGNGFNFNWGGSALISPVADFTINPAGPTCAASVNITITDNSTGIPTYDFGDGTPTYTGNNPPVHTYNTPGTYAITASIGGACPSTHTEFVQLFGPVVPVATPVVETCVGDCDGSISLATTGGSGNYTYAWNPPAGQTTPVITGLCANNYSVTVTDAVCGNVVLPVVLAAGPVCVTCAMDSMPVIMTNCNNNLPFLTYDVSGTVYFNNPPATGTLTITDCNGGNQVFNAPFGTSQAFTFLGLPHTGTNCAFTAVFSADPTCTITTNFMSPAPITAFSMNTGFCINNTFSVDGTISFSTPPTTGTLTISVNDGTSNYDTIINAPFTSPENWSISGIPTGGGAFTVTYFWSGFPSCTQIANGTAPASCGCGASVGTYTANIVGDGTTPYKLCFGDQFTLTSNGDNVDPDFANAPPIPAPAGYNPGLGYLIYSCPPSIFPPNNIWDAAGNPLDPCVIGVAGFGSSFNDINFLGGPSYAGAFTNSTIYYVPITFYDTINGYYSYTNTVTNCYDLGIPFSVQYLPQITSTVLPDCLDSSVTVTLNGGLPALDASLFTATNLLPANANFVNNTTPNGGNIVINGLLDGDMYSFDVADSNGCPINISGGPFVGLPNANTNVDDTSCTLTYNLNAIPSIGTGAWTGPTGVNFAPANSANATATATTPGTYTLTWTETNTPGCTSTDNVDVTFLSPITTAAVDDCQDSSVTVTVTNGLPEVNASLYTASNLLPATASFVNNTATHNGTIIINGLLNGDMYSFDLVDDNGCTGSINGGPFVGLPNANANADDTSCTLTYNLNAIPSIGTGTWTGPAGVIFAPANSPTATVTVPLAGSYTFTWTEDNTGGCTSTDDVTILFNILSIPNTPTNPLCNNGNDGQIILAPQGGISPYSYQWNATANNQITNPATNLGAGSYTVTVTDAFGCFLDSTFTLTEPTPFSYTTTSVNANCGNPDGSATVVGFAGGTPGYTYDWGAGPIANNTLSNLIPGIYTVTVTDAATPTGCDTTFTITVGNNTSFTASISASTNATCNGSTDGTATADGSDPLVAYTFLWDAAAGNQPTQTANGLGAGTYVVTVTDPNSGCSDIDSVVINEPALVVINTISPAVTICVGQNTNITATASGGSGAGYVYTWDNGLGVGQVQNVAPVNTTTYTVTVVDDNNCPSSPATVTVTLNPPLNVVASADVNICPNGQAPLSAVANGGNGGPYTYSWNNGVGLGQNQQVNPAVATTYIVTLSDGCSPDVYDTVLVNINPLPVVVFSVDTLSICETPNRPFEFYNTTDTTGGMVGSASWNFGDNGTAIGDTVSHSYAGPGSYNVTLTITSSISAGGCTNSLTKANYVEVFNDPVADFSSNPTSATMFDPTIDFTDQSYTNIQTWDWNFGGLDTSDIQHPSYTFPEDTGTYLILLTVVDGNGCTNSTSNFVIIRGEYGLYIPNSFTPDGDGLNDGFAPNGFGISEQDYSFFIYDRWGELIFESYEKFAPWFGTYKDKIVPNDVYVWKLNFKDINGKKHTEIGRVSVVK